MQQLVLACGYNPFGYVIFFFIMVIPFGLTLGIKWFFLAKTPRSPRRSLFLDSFGLTLIAGMVIGSLIFIPDSYVPDFLYELEIGIFYPYQFLLLAIICLIDTFLIDRWSLKPNVQAISMTDDQQLQVEAVTINYQPVWVVALQSNTLIGILIILFFQMFD